jgi:hypothetical protein
MTLLHQKLVAFCFEEVDSLTTIYGDHFIKKLELINNKIVNALKSNDVDSEDIRVLKECQVILIDAFKSVI